jgi:hypothetical protein
MEGNTLENWAKIIHHDTTPEAIWGRLCDTDISEFIRLMMWEIYGVVNSGNRHQLLMDYSLFVYETCHKTIIKKISLHENGFVSLIVERYYKRSVYTPRKLILEFVVNFDTMGKDKELLDPDSKESIGYALGMRDLKAYVLLHKVTYEIIGSEG